MQLCALIERRLRLRMRRVEDEKDENGILGKCKNSVIMNMLGIFVAVPAVVMGSVLHFINLNEIVEEVSSGMLE